MAVQKSRKYGVYLLRCWQESGEIAVSGVWRFSLENPRTGQRRGFASLEALVLALQGELAAADQEEPGGAPGPGHKSEEG